MEIRPASTEDAEAIAPLLTELGYPVEPEAVRARLDRIATSGDRTGVLLAELEGVPAALTCRITALVTDREHRRRGAAAGLLAAVAELARQGGCERLEVTTRPDRDDALGFYLGAGFTERPRRLVRSLA